MQRAMRVAIAAADPHRARCFEQLRVDGVDRRGWERMVCAVCGRFYGYRPFWLREGAGERMVDLSACTGASVRRRRRRVR